MSRLKGRDRQAPGVSVRSLLRRVAWCYFPNSEKEEVSEEVLQDVFLKIWDRIGQYDAGKGKLFTWLLNIARNQAIDKTRSREISKDQKTGGIENLVNRIDNEGYIEQRIEDIGVQEILKGLSQEQQFVVEYLYFKGYSQAELAEEFNIPLGTVKTRLRLAYAALTNQFGSDVNIHEYISSGVLEAYAGEHSLSRKERRLRTTLRGT